MFIIPDKVDIVSKIVALHDEDSLGFDEYIAEISLLKDFTQLDNFFYLIVLNTQQPAGTRVISHYQESASSVRCDRLRREVFSAVGPVIL
jgi:hypothetical protein